MMNSGRCVPDVDNAICGDIMGIAECKWNDADIDGRFNNDIFAYDKSDRDANRDSVVGYADVILCG